LGLSTEARFDRLKTFRGEVRIVSVLVDPPEVYSRLEITVEIPRRRLTRLCEITFEITSRESRQALHLFSIVRKQSDLLGIRRRLLFLNQFDW
jgi:hypothetical protein